MYPIKFYIQAFRINSDPKGQSQEKGMSISSPIFVLLFFFRSKIEKATRCPERPTKNPTTNATHHESLYPNFFLCHHITPPKEEAR